MDKELRALIRKLDRSMCDGELVVDFHLDIRVKAIVARWLRTCGSTVLAGTSVYVVAEDDVQKLEKAKPMKVKRFE